MILRLPVLVMFAVLALPAKSVFSTSGRTVATYDFVEVSVHTSPGADNPFTNAEFTGQLLHDGEQYKDVEGFCDSPDGTVFRIRFMADKPGAYKFMVSLRRGTEVERYEGSFLAENGGRRGPIRVDAEHPFHFIWEGTGEHYFWNGLTTYALMGWQDESTIQAIIDRAASLKINRLRVSLNGPRVADASRWYEPVKPSPAFHFLFGPWIGAHPERTSDPGWDVTRYDIAFWQKYDRMVRYARDRNVIVSVIFFLDGEDAGADPFGKQNAFGPDEKRYYRYAAARLAAYSNVTWDVTNEWHLFRSAWWVEEMGTYLKALDPWKHLMSCHGRNEFPWVVSFWPDFAMFQLWDEDGGYRPMLAHRTAQAETGRPMPQINEEYGYEDHYPVKWGGNRRPPARSADNRRRLAWEISMAGCYQTTGERANSGGDGALASPGGWINGGFDPSMTMLQGYARMVEFFQSMDYWKLAPMPELVTGNALVLAERGKRYVLYYREPAQVAVQLEGGKYASQWYDPRTGIFTASYAALMERSGKWNAPVPPGPGDWVLLLQSSGR